MAALEITFDAQTLEVLKSLTDAIQGFNETQQRKLNATIPGACDWLTASHFCEKYDISRSTLTRRVKDGKVERQEFDDDVIRYRMPCMEGA